MKKNALIFLLCIICLSGTAAVRADTGSDALPDVAAQGAVLMDFNTGRVLWEKNGRQALPMASTTKIMTGIMALEKGNLNDTVTVSKLASLAPDVQMDLAAGEEITLESLLYALMLESANDSAVAIAEHIGGSVEDFCAMMTQKAKELGAEDTIFETPNGLDRGEHHSTARDMALIARYAMQNPDFIRIINTKSVTVSSNKRSYALNNKNRLLNGFEGGNGIKTGFTGKAGHCFVGAAKRGDMQLISVVLASGWGNRGKEQKWTDTRTILNYGFKNYKYHPIITSGEQAGETLVTRSRTEKIGYAYANGLTLPLTDAEHQSLQIKINAPDSVEAPVKQGAALGTAQVYIGDELSGEITLLSKSAAARHDFKTSLDKILSVIGFQAEQVNE